MLIKDPEDYGNIVVLVDYNKEIMENEVSEIEKYLCNEKVVEVERSKLSDKWIKIGGARENNLKNIDIRFLIEAVTCITGVSIRNL